MNAKLLFVISKLSYGGAEKNLVRLANRFAEDGSSVHLITFDDSCKLQTVSPKIHLIVIQSFLSAVPLVKRIYQIIHFRMELIRIKPDVTISFLTFPNIISIIGSISSYTPVIISERGDPFVFQSWFTRLRDFIYRFADGYVFQSNQVKRYFKQEIQKKGIIIPNPVEVSKTPERWTGERESIIVNVGRFDLKQKRQDLLITAFSRIAPKYPNMKLVLFGDGDDEQEIREIIRKYQLENRIILGGYINNILEAIKKAKLFVLASDYEGFPNALIEAMSIGLPCISTDFSPGSASEIIRHMENGMLVKAGSIEELSKAMDYLLGNPQEAEILGENAFEIRSLLDSEVIFNKWRTYINDYIK